MESRELALSPSTNVKSKSSEEWSDHKPTPILSPVHPPSGLPLHDIKVPRYFAGTVLPVGSIVYCKTN